MENKWFDETYTNYGLLMKHFPLIIKSFGTIFFFGYISGGVSRIARPQFFCELGKQCPPASRQHYLRTLLDESLRRRQTDSAAGTGNQCHLAIKTSHRCFLPACSSFVQLAILPPPA